MTTAKDILNFFEGFAPVETAMDFDNCGLLVGSGDAEITRALVSLDITAEVVKEAKALGCELIISHHPVIFNSLKRIESDSVPYLLIQNNLSAICMHTNLDLSESLGVNTCLAEAVGVKNLRLCQNGECLFMGELEKELPIEEFALIAKKALNCGGLRFTDKKAKIKTVAVSSGSGGSNIFDAAANGADALLTGEIKHHEINAANALGVDVIDVGHFKSEDVVILPLIKKLSGAFSEVEFRKSTVYSDYTRYI